MSIKLVSNGGGSVTIAEPNTASDFTLSVPAATADLLTSSSDLTTQVKSATNASGSAPIYSCRAWIKFNGTGTPSISASGNVSSITDIATGQYELNFTTAMPDDNYAIMGAVNDNAGLYTSFRGTYSTTKAPVDICITLTGGNADFSRITVAVFR